MLCPSCSRSVFDCRTVNTRPSSVNRTPHRVRPTRNAARRRQSRSTARRGPHGVEIVVAPANILRSSSVESGSLPFCAVPFTGCRPSQSDQLVLDLIPITGKLMRLRDAVSQRSTVSALSVFADWRRRRRRSRVSREARALFGPAEILQGGLARLVGLEGIGRIWSGGRTLRPAPARERARSGVAGGAGVRPCVASTLPRRIKFNKLP